MSIPDLGLSEQLPEISYDLSIQEVRAKPRKLKVKWSLEAADDLRRLLSPLLVGDYVLDKARKRVVKVLKVATTYDMVTGDGSTFEVEDILTGEVYAEKEEGLGDPLNEMEVLAYVQDTE